MQAWEALGDVRNLPVPTRVFLLCHCHGWRIDECPNVGVAVWARQQGRPHE